MSLELGLCLALVSTVALNWGYFAQHGAAVALPPLHLRRPLRSLRALLGSRRWLAGFLVGIGGWGLYVEALSFAPLSLVQAASAGGIGVLALLVQFSPGTERLRPREWGAVALSLAGLGLLGISLAGSHVSRAPSAGAVAVVVGLAAVGAVAVGVAGRSAAARGAAAGILYAAGDVATKAVVASAGLVFVPVVLAAHGLAFVFVQLGFQRGKALATVGLATLLTNALPIAAGAALFGERLPPGGSATAGSPPSRS